MNWRKTLISMQVEAASADTAVAEKFKEILEKVN